MKGLNCPQCESPKSRVIETRQSGSAIFRRKQCGECDRRYSTYEVSAAFFEEIKTLRQGLDEIATVTHRLADLSKRETEELQPVNARCMGCFKVKDRIEGMAICSDCAHQKKTFRTGENAA